MTRLILTALYTLWSLATATNGQTLTIEARNSAGAHVGGSPYTGVSSVSLPGTTARVNIFVNGGTSSFSAPRITLTNGPTSGNLDIVIGVGPFITTDTPLVFADAMVCGSWAGLVAPSSAANTRLYGRVTGNLTNDLSNVDQVGLFRIDGALSAALTIPLPLQTSPTFLAIEAGSFSSSGRIVLTEGTINRVRVFGNIEQLSGGTGTFPIGQTSIAAASGNITLIDVAGDLRGDIVARPSSFSAGGAIGTITVGGHIGRSFTAGTFGDPDSAADFPTLSGGLLNQSVLCIEASNGIGTVEADSMTCIIEADRDAGFGASQGDVGFIITEFEGSFKGSIKARGLQDAVAIPDPNAIRLDIKKDFRARLLLGFDQSVTQTRLGRSPDLIKIGGSVLPIVIPESNLSGIDPPDDAFQFPNSNDLLSGQIIINANNNGSTWNSPAVFNGVTLNPPDYGATSASLGGGAIGQAPFQLHKLDCVPQHEAAGSVLTSQFATPGVALLKIRHYGPVTTADAGSDGPTPAQLDAVLSVEMRTGSAGADPCRWFPMDQPFTFQRDPSDKRTILIKSSGTVPKPGIYRVIKNGLRSELVTDTPEVIWPVSCGGETSEAEAYIFTLLYDCNNNGVADSTDIANTPSLDVDPQDGIIDACQNLDCRCDYDPNLFIDADDIFAFLDIWFAATPGSNCPAPPAQCPADFNLDGVITADDIFAFLDCWFAAGPGTSCE